MPLRNVAAFVAAILLGLVAVIGVRSYLSGHQVAGAVSAGGTPVVVVATPVARGAPVTAAMLKVVKYPSDGVPTGAFQTPDQLLNANGGAHVALRPLAINEPVIADAVTGAGGKAGMSASLTAGMRAVSMRSSDVAGVAGFALPGDRVDVMVTRNVGSGQEASAITQILAQNVRVLGIDQAADVDPNKPVVSKAITIEVTPDQAAAIQLAQSLGTVALSLRQLSDTEPTPHQLISVRDLGGYDDHSKPKPAVSRRKAKAAPSMGLTQVNVTRGVQMTGYSVSTF